MSLDDTATLNVAGPTAADLERLSDSFAVFNRVTRDLEASYQKLRLRTERVDARLGEANRRLLDKVAELNGVTERLHSTLDAVPCGVVVCDAAGTIQDLNRAAERILGRAACELIGRDARTVRGRNGLPLLVLGTTDDGPAPADREFEALDGAVRRVSSTLATLPDGARLEVLSDLTEVTHLRTQLNRLDTLAALGEMAAGIAHEIRNPLNGIDGFAALMGRSLAAGPVTDCGTLSRYVERMRQGVTEVNEIITNLLLWARPERLVKATFPLRDLVGDIVAGAAVLAGSPEHARIQTKLPAAMLLGDRIKLRLAVTNLVRNALEAAGPSGVVTIAAAVGRTGLTLTVNDSGAGVPAQLRSRLFRPFATGKASGNGLGLAIARKLVEVHGGELTLTSGDLAGACFELTLPAPCIARGGEKP